MKQTAVEYLVEQLKEYDFSPRDNTYLIEIPLWIWKEKVEQAKEMEKQQIIKAFNEGTFSEMEKIDAEQCGGFTFKYITNENI